MSRQAMVIVGAGECGGRAAVSLREHGWDGPITLIGAEAHPPYERPPLSKGFFVRGQDCGFKGNADSARFAELSIKHRASCRVASIDRCARTVHLEDGEAIAYHRLLLATGAQARRMSLAGAKNVQVLRNHGDALALRPHFAPGKRVVIVGGGFIGLELAASAVQAGASVSLIEAQPRLLARNVPADIAAIVEHRHRAVGVAFFIGAGITTVETGGTVVLATGERVGGDIVVAGIGAVPDVALAQAAGLDVDNGIVADACLRTSDPAIYAAGDCASVIHPLFGSRRLRLESWRNAREQGVLAAQNMLDQNCAQEAIPWFWSDHYELTLQIAGLPDMGVTAIDRRTEDALLKFHLDASGRLVGASAVGPLDAIARDIRIAEMLIARQCHPDPNALGQPDHRLKSLLAA